MVSPEPNECSIIAFDYLARIGDAERRGVAQFTPALMRLRARMLPPTSVARLGVMLEVMRAVCCCRGDAPTSPEKRMPGRLLALARLVAE